MKTRRILAILLTILCVAQSPAVLREKDLARTLGVLRAELQMSYEKQKQFMAMYEQQGATQHQRLVNYMHKCEQISLMLYSQTTENTFDMAYACQQAINLFSELNNQNGKMNQYDKIIAGLKIELERYDSLIVSLKSMPPVIADNDSVLSANDSILLQAIDSLSNNTDVTKPVDSTLTASMMPSLPNENISEEETEDEEPNLPLYLTGEPLKDRIACLRYAEIIRNNLQKFLESMEAENSYYKSVRTKVLELNAFAQSRYKILQDNIFKNGSSNYFSMLFTLPMQTRRAERAWETKYKPFAGHSAIYSEWRGASVLFISVFLVMYLAIAWVLSYVALRWLLPKKWRGKDFRLKREMLNNVVGIALFAIIVMVVRTFTDRNFIQMGTRLIINMAWLLEVIFLSLFIRLKDEQMRHAAIIYMPLMLLAFIVILFRIVLIPNAIVNLIFPPILLGFTIWQLVLSKRHREGLPLLDVVYSHLTTAAMIISTLAAWTGYCLLAVQVMVWWTFQLAAIMTITCLYDLMEMFEKKYLIYHVRPDLKKKEEAGKDISADVKIMLDKMQRGEYVTQTWFYDLFNRTLVPIFAVASVLVSIYWAAKTFEMTSICHRIFFMDIVHQTNLIRISLYRICVVVALWFVFRYLNYIICSFYSYFRRKTIKDNQTYNLTLARNIIGIICWGLYIIISLVILEVPKSGISIVSAGLATGLGFAMQSILENFFYGINLMAGRLHVGDYIVCDGISGKVESITYQSTQIVTADGSVISFLNSALFSKNFKNLTRNHRYELIKIPIGVAYGSDIQQVRQLLTDAIAPICKERNAAGKYITNVNTPVNIMFSDFGESSVDLLVCIWMLVEEKIMLTSRVKEIIYNTLNENNIEIPFPQRDVHMKTMP